MLNYEANLVKPAALNLYPHVEQLPGQIKSEIPNLQSKQRVSS